MEIAEIRLRLGIAEAARHYGLPANGGQSPIRIRCPFHDDRTPSMVLYPQTGTFCCFSGNCDAGTGDVIEFVRLMEKCTKREAIMKAKEMAGHAPEIARIPNQNKKAMTKTPPKETEITRTQVLLRFMQGCAEGLKKSRAAKEYLASRKLPRTEGMGYCGPNAMRRWEADWKEAAEREGLLRNGKPHFAGCLVFPLLDADNAPSGFYGRFIGEAGAKHRYLPGGIQGIYPHYPKKGTERIILAESVLDAASVQAEGMEALALYGTQGLKQEHLRALAGCNGLKEVVLMLDGDEAGRTAAAAMAKRLKEANPDWLVSIAELPEGEDCNSLAQSHESGILKHFADNARPFPSSIEENREDAEAENKPLPKLEETSPHRIGLRTEGALYEVSGRLPAEWESLKVSLRVTARQGSYRAKTDLYETRQTEKLARELAERLGIAEADALHGLQTLCGLLDERREELEQSPRGRAPKATESDVREAMGFLREPSLFKRLNRLIGESGVVGEERNRLLLFLTASSRGTADPLHALVQGGSGSGKTHLMGAICSLMPAEHTYRYTRITEGALFNYGEHELSGRLLAIEDMDGLGENAVYALRELQSSGMLRSGTSGKDALGNSKSGERIVYGPIASLACTTKGHIYEDNAGRCLTVAVDESREQTLRVIAYQNAKAAGEIDKAGEERAKQFAQRLCRLIKPLEVVNPYASKVMLPEDSQKLRRLHPMLLGLVDQSARWHQYQRRKDGAGRIIAMPEDIKLAAHLMFESIVLKVDELDGQLRSFFERLKAEVGNKEQSFTQREIRQSLGISKTQLHRHIQGLMELEYVQIIGGHANRGYQYRIAYWDDNEALRKRIKDHLFHQIERL